MGDVNLQSNAIDNSSSNESTATTLTRPKPRPAPRSDRLPPWNVLLHNDDVNELTEVIVAIRQLTPLTTEQATRCMLEAHTRGLALILSTHREHAELLAEQFCSKNLTVTIEPAL